MSVVRSAQELKAFIKTRIAASPLISVLADNPDFDNSIIGQFIECFAEELEVITSRAQTHIEAVEDQINKTNPHTYQWIRQKALEFQYDDNEPQVLVDTDGLIGYETVDESMRPVVYCSVRGTASRKVSVFVGGEDLTTPLSTNVLNSLNAYFNSFLQVSNGLAGLTAEVLSASPDICYLKGTVYYYGQRSATIQANVTAAIERFLAEPRIDGVLTAQNLIKAVTALDGVADLVIDDLAVRVHGLGFGFKTYIIQNKVDQLVTPLSTAGYYITETESGEELATRLTFTAI